MSAVRFINADCFDYIANNIDDNTIDAVITDPPYFLDSMGINEAWDSDKLSNYKTNNQIVSSLKGGMKFDKQQGIDFQKAMSRLANAVIGKLKPGGWLVAFSAPRLYHRLGVAFEDAGFEIRDMMEWLYLQNQMKAMGLQRQLIKDKNNITDDEYKMLSDELSSWKTPQMKSCFEPIVLAQKPREGTFYDNWKKYHIGLVNVHSNVGIDSNQVTANVMTTDDFSDYDDRINHAFLVSKPNKTEKAGTNHPSVKPIALMKHIIEMLIPSGGLILDPFNGSGTTGFAAFELQVNFIGTEINDSYYQQSLLRASNLGYSYVSINSNNINGVFLRKSEENRTLFDLE